MDLKGSLVNTKLKIVPSKKLTQFLEKISITKETPKNIVNIIKGKPCVVDEYSREENKNNYELTDKDYEVIKKVKAVIKPEQNNTKNIEDEGEKVNENEDEKFNENKDEKVNENKDKKINENKDKKINENKDKKFNENKDEKVNENKDEKVNKNEPERDSETFLTTSDIDWLYTYLNKSSDTKQPYLHELLEGSEILLPENEVLKRNPELEARCVTLRAQQEAREYRKMTKSVDNVRVRYPEDNINYQLKQLNRQLIAIGQFILSIFAGFLFGFRGVEWMVGNLDFGFRLLLGVMCALVIALAEIYFLAKKLNEELNMVETTQLGGPTKLKNVYEDPYEKYFRKNEEVKEHKD